MSQTFNHPKGRVIRDDLTVTLIVTTDDGKDYVRQRKTYETLGRADLGFWDAVDWLRTLKG
jgi:hypothetical protein